MELSNFERRELLKYLNSYARRLNSEPLDLFQKGQVFNYLNSVDKEVNPNLGKISTKDSNSVATHTEIIKQEISDDKIKEIIQTVKSEIVVKDGRDGRDSPQLADIVAALKNDFEFIQQLKPNVPRWTGTGGYGKNDILQLIHEEAIPLNPKYFGEMENGNWRIRQDGEHLRFEYMDGGVWLEQYQISATNRYVYRLPFASINGQESVPGFDLRHTNLITFNSIDSQESFPKFNLDYVDQLPFASINSQESFPKFNLDANLILLSEDGYDLLTEDDNVILKE